MITNLPFVNLYKKVRIEGVLRFDESNSKTVILIPPKDITKTGPHRLFAELSFYLLSQNINSCSFDITGAKLKGELRNGFYVDYDKYIETVIFSVPEISKNNQNEIFLLLFCDSCKVIMQNSFKKEITKFILLSPTISLTELIKAKENINDFSDILCVFEEKDLNKTDFQQNSKVDHMLFKQVHNSNYLFYSWESRNELFAHVGNWIKDFN